MDKDNVSGHTSTSTDLQVLSTQSSSSDQLPESSTLSAPETLNELAPLTANTAIDELEYHKRRDGMMCILGFASGSMLGAAILSSNFSQQCHMLGNSLVAGLTNATTYLTNATHLLSLAEDLTDECVENSNGDTLSQGFQMFFYTAAIAGGFGALWLCSKNRRRDLNRLYPSRPTERESHNTLSAYHQHRSDTEMTINAAEESILQEQRQEPPTLLNL